MKIDKDIKSLWDKADNLANGNGLTDEIIICDDDDYYLARGSEPPRFKYYKHVRAEKWRALGHKPLLDEDYDHSITQEELDFILKRELWLSPEERYQHEKRNWLFHDLSLLHE